MNEELKHKPYFEDLIASEIAQFLFTIGSGEEASRLVMEFSSPITGPGWSKKVVADRISMLLYPHLKIWMDQIVSLETALRQIAEHPSCQYNPHHNTQYGIGVADGHRCAATIAKAALENSGTTGTRGDD